MNAERADLLLRALVCHLYKTGGSCIITNDDLVVDKVLEVIEEDGKLTINVKKRTNIVQH